MKVSKKLGETAYKVLDSTMYCMEHWENVKQYAEGVGDE